MSAYRYVVFPPGSAPTLGELDAFRGYARLLNDHIAQGTRRGDGGLALACEAEPFDRLRGVDPGFDELLLKWRARGGEVVEKLAFVKDSKAWRRVERPPAKTRQQRSLALPAEDKRSDTQKRHDAKEAEGRTRLEAARLAARAESFQRAAAWMPYALWGLSAAAVLVTGGYLASRLLSAGGERRAQTIERVATDAMGEALPSQDPTAARAE